MLNTTQRQALQEVLKVAVDTILNLQSGKDYSKYLAAAIEPVKMTPQALAKLIDVKTLEKFLLSIKIPAEVREHLLLIKKALESGLSIPEASLKFLAKYPNYNLHNLADLDAYSKKLRQAGVEENVHEMLLRVREAYLEMTAIDAYSYDYFSFQYRDGTVPFNLNTSGPTPDPEEIQADVAYFVQSRLELFAEYKTELEKRLNLNSAAAQLPSAPAQTVGAQSSNLNATTISTIPAATSRRVVNSAANTTSVANNVSSTSTQAAVLTSQNLRQQGMFRTQQRSPSATTISDLIRATGIRPNVKVLVLGNANMPKTVFVDKARQGELFTETLPRSLGIDFISTTINGTKFQIWDTAGQERFNHFYPTIARDAKLIFIMAEDLTSLTHWHTLISEVVPAGTQFCFVHTASSLANQASISPYLTQHGIGSFNFVTHNASGFVQDLIWDTYQNYLAQNPSASTENNSAEQSNSAPSRNCILQ